MERECRKYTQGRFEKLQQIVMRKSGKKKKGIGGKGNL
jgi:hypothetical protein